MKYFRNRSFLVAAVTTAALCLNHTPTRAANLTVNQNNDPNALINFLLGDTTGLDINSFSVQTNGNAQAFGTFQTDPFGLAKGVVLSTGKVTDIPGVNRAYTLDADLITDFGVVGVSGDTISMQIDFTNNTAKTLYFQYVFGSEEFPEYVGSKYNDNFTLKLNNQSLAVLSNGSAVTINNLGRSSDLILNPPVNGPANRETKLDGYSKPLLFQGDLLTGNNTLIITVGDVSDGKFDSAVFLKAGTLGTVKPPDISGGASGCGSIVGGGGTSRDVGGTTVDTGYFSNCVNLGRPDGGIPVTTPPDVGTAVPEPFTICGTLLGGAAAFRMRKRFRATNQLSANGERQA